VSFARAAHGIETPAAIGGWLRITTARAALTIAQRQRRCIPSEFPLEIGLPASEPEPVLLDNEVDAVRDAVARLQKQDRELISLLFEAQLTYAEVEARTGRPVGAIGPTRQRVMAKLRSDRAIRRLALDPAS
jgi:DNA-directed RNA polymerase specialized sigma24 family protein